MIELCYPNIVPKNEKIDQNAIPQLISCVNKLNTGVAFMQAVSEKLAENEERIWLFDTIKAYLIKKTRLASFCRTVSDFFRTFCFLIAVFLWSRGPKASDVLSLQPHSCVFSGKSSSNSTLLHLSWDYSWADSINVFKVCWSPKLCKALLLWQRNGSLSFGHPRS